MAYDAGEAFLRIVPSFNGVIERINAQAAQWGTSSGKEFANRFNDEVRRNTNVPVGPSQQQTRRQGEQTGRTFADSFKARVDAALKSLPDIQINADSTAAEVRIARLRTNLEQLRDQRVGVDIDTATALASIENIKRQIDELNRESPDVAVQIDTARASAELARIQAEIDALRTEDPQVDVEVDDHGSAARTAADVNLLHAALIALSPAAIPVGAALIGGLAGAAATLGAVAGGAGVLAIGLSGVSKATDLLNQRQVALAQSGASNINSARQVEQAERGLSTARYNAAQQAITSAEQVKNARQSLADTERQLARQEIQDARDVASAQRDLADAQKAVNDAREQAKRDLENSANRAADATLAQQQAALDLTSAQQNLDTVNANAASTDQQKQQAALDLAKAQQAYTEAQLEAKRATDDNTKAQKAGVAGSASVVNALRQQQDATERLRDAREKQKQDAADGARQIAKAEQQITDALRNQTNQARASAEAIKNAGDAVASAMASGSSAGSTQLAKVNAELAKVNPATLAFANYVRNHLTPAWAKLKDTAASNFLPGLEKGFRALQPLMGPINRLVGAVAGTLGNLATQAGRALSGPFWRQFIAFLTKNLPPLLETFGRVVGNVAKGFAGLMEAFQPIVDLIGRGLLNLSRQFANFGANAGKNKAFQAFLGYIRQVGPTVVDLVGHLAGILGKLIQGLAPLGAVLVKAADGLARFLANLSPNQLLLLIGAIAAVVAYFGGPFMAIIVAVTAAAALLAANWDKVKRYIMPVVDLLRGIAHKAFEGIRSAIDTVSRAIDGHRKQLNELGNLFKVVIGFIVQKVLPVIGVALKYAFWLVGESLRLTIDLIAGLVEGFHWMVDAGQSIGAWFSGPFVNFFTGAWRDIVRIWGNITGAFSSAWGWVRDTFSSLWHRVESIVTTPVRDARSQLSSAWSNIRGAFRSAWEWVRDTFSSLWHRTTELITAPIDAAKTALGRVWGGIKSAARTFVSDMKNIWGGLEDVFKAPIKFLVNTVLNGGLIKAWNFIADKVPGVDITINPIKLPKGFATGGVYPGYTPGRDVGLIAVSGGEAIMRPEWTRAVGPDYVHAANSAARAGGESGVRQFLGGFANGGIIDGFAPGGVANPANWLDWFRHKIDGPLNAIKKFGGTDIGKIIVGMPNGVAQAMIDAIKGFASDALSRAANIGAGIAGKVLGGGVHVGGTVDLSGGPAANQGIGRQLAARLGWNTGANWADLVSLWNKESGWSEFADTRVSGLDPAGATEFAYGIAQARPASKYPLAGRPSDMGGRSDPASQIGWGLNYIRGRYGSPAAAWAHELAYNWYDRGGELPPGPSLVYNGTGQAELVAPRQSFEQIIAGSAKDTSNGPTFLMPITQQPNEDGAALAERVSGRIDFRLRSRG